MSRKASQSNKVSGLGYAECMVFADCIPEQLSDRDQWVCWRYTHDGAKKPPYDPESGENSSVHEPNTWTDFSTALEAFRRRNYDGIGFVLTDDDSLVGLDFDGCRDPETGEIQQEIVEIIGILESYTETSPSATGLHTITLGESPGMYKNTDGIEVYDSERYFTVTGKHLTGTPRTIEPRNEELQSICEKYLPEKSDTALTESLPDDLPEVDEDAVATVNAALQDFASDQTNTQWAFSYLIDLLKGRNEEKYGFIGDHGNVDRSETELVTAGILYGVIIHYVESPNHTYEELIYHFLNYAYKKNRWTSDGQLRRWLTAGKKYHWIHTIERAVKTFDIDTWNCWRQKKSLEGYDSGNPEYWTGDYSNRTYEVVYNSVTELSNPPPPVNRYDTPKSPDLAGSDGAYSYPAKNEIIALTQRKDPHRSERTHQTALARLRDEYSQVKMAHLSGNDYVYYPARYPDPPGVASVKIGGELHDPEIPEDDSIKELLTEGGLS